MEFAFIAPLLLSMYFVTMEVSQGIEANKKVGRIGSMVADLVTQQSSVKLDDVKAIMDIGQSILQPYGRSRPKITITAINVSYAPSPEAKVAWSVRMEANGTYSKPFNAGDSVTIPDELMFDQDTIEKTFLIRVESELAYRPVITWSASGKPALGLAAAFDGIAMGETYYMRPRMSKEIGCSNC
ncbi:MAG: TadE/TadG family type IV pilus assembly protein [Pseudaminobacter sp.]